MSKSDAFAEKFRELLKEIPDDYTLEQWQQAYRQAIFLMGMKILERFEEAAIAQTRRGAAERRAAGKNEAVPAVTGGGPVILYIASHGGGAGGGPNPSVLQPCCDLFPDYPLALQELVVPRGPARRKK